MVQRFLLKYRVLPNSTKFFIYLIFFGIVLELFVFYRLPKQAWTEALLEAWYTNNGLIFYKDFTNQYFPLLHMLMVPYHILFGFTQTPTLVLAPINSLLVLTLLSIISYKWLNGWFRILPIIFFLFWDPVLSENHYSTLGFLELVNLSVFILWRIWFKHRSNFIAFMVGLGLSASLLSMHIVILYVLVVFLLTFILTLKNKKTFLSFIYMIIGFLIPAIFIIVWILNKGAWESFYYWNIAYYFSGYYPYASMGRGFVNTTLFIAVFSPILFFLRLFYLNIRTFKVKEIFKNKNLLELVCITLILLSLPITIWFAIFHPIRFQLALPIFAFAFGFGFQSLIKLEKRINLNLLVIIIVILGTNILSFFIYMLPKYQSGWNYPQKYNILSKIYPNDPMYTTIEWIKKNTESDARLFVLADPLFYIETDRLPANPRGTMSQPFVFQPLSVFTEEIKTKTPDYWIIDERLLSDRFYEFGYGNIAEFFNKLFECEPIATKIEYITIRKHIKGGKFCI